MTADVVVAGGGVIGTAIAWRAAAAGLRVTVVDPGRGDAATQVAAGMLAPVSESMFGEDALLRLNLLAVRRFPAFAAGLEAATGRVTGLRREGTLAVAYDPGDHAALRRLTGFRRSAGLDAQELDGRACRRLEPFLAPGVHGGVLFAGDWSVDNRRYAAALREAMAAAGVRTVRGTVAEVLTSGGRTAGVRLGAGPAAGAAGATPPPGAAGPAGAPETPQAPDADADATVIEAGAVVVAAGCWSGAIGGLPGWLPGVLRPVKGQLLRLRLPRGMPPVLGHTVRALVRGVDVYLVPRADGEMVVGATSEERGFDRTVTAGAVHDLLRDALSVLPVAGELTLAETCCGLRPGTLDNGPVVGPAAPDGAGAPPSGAGAPDGLLLATGHYRNGVLLSAATADAVAAYLTGGRPAAEWGAFSPARFTAGVVPR